MIHKGLENAIGHNNCFLNVVVQILWHCDTFRITLQQHFSNAGLTISEMRLLVDNENATEITLINAVCLLFLDYQYTLYEVLDPERVRETLWLLSGKFQFGEIADANEAFEEILKQLHREHKACASHEINNKCLAHRYV